jgi:hypothetical protein
MNRIRRYDSRFEIVGRAASIACRYGVTPRAVYEDHFDELKGLVVEPGKYRQEL